MTVTRCPRSQQRGVTLIEILVTVLIIAFGVLGLIGMNMKVQGAQADAYQRAQAILRLQDMANRIAVNRANAASYVTPAPIGTGTTIEDCSTLSGAALDKCEWGNQLRGAAEQAGTTAVGAMINAKGCIAQLSASPPVYQVMVSWQGTSELSTPSLSCGSGSYPRETLRRTIGTTVSMACLSCP